MLKNSVQFLMQLRSIWNSMRSNLGRNLPHLITISCISSIHKTSKLVWSNQKYTFCCTIISESFSLWLKSPKKRCQGTKGQMISKCPLGVFNFLQKTNENKSTWVIIVVKLNSFVHFLEEIDDLKNHFEINWPLIITFTRNESQQTTLINKWALYKYSSFI